MKFEQASMRLDKVRSGLTEHVYGYVKEQLLDGHYGPDDWIPIEEITVALGVSRQPVMSALKRLGLEGLVTIQPQVGCRPRRYEVEEAIDFYHLFAEGEALLAQFAAERARPEDIIELKILSAHIAELTNNNDDAIDVGRAYRTLNNRWHAELHRIARSPVVAQTVEIQRDLSDFFVAAINRPIFSERLTAAHHEHEELVKAVAANDGQRARMIMREHVLAIADRFIASR